MTPFRREMSSCVRHADDENAPQVDRFNDLPDEPTKTMSDLYRSFTSPEATRQLNLAPTLLKRINLDVKHTQTITLPSLELIFTDAQAGVENILATDIYPRVCRRFAVPG